MSLKTLIDHFKSHSPLKEKEIEALNERFVERTIKRHSFILQEGDVCRHVTFVVAGCLRMYVLNRKGKEYNIQFAAENDWITELSSFYSEKPSGFYIEAVEQSIILQIKHADLLYLYTNFQKFDRNFRIIMEKKYIELQNRVLQNIRFTAEERYQYFLKEYPHLATRLPNTQIASYLGVTPEFLSMIRKKLVS
ncbi:cyclic nucleotide-binding domain-containing protein [Pedobacter sp. HMF7647]|uniref:Cyclic nucleotide-binding domain-containing protein n=1 Tax=Hufsiella arboris TaxID=2695275 RepID=A0A7K1YAL8_9SPHI|nr:Crp/Fnr family transcriptional regulator [Hufsiella arboris]MXV51149.1 cyclic nucleotide-binding domain-containing protein [Hufsiella arboris]